MELFLESKIQRFKKEKIFILRNNDLGDVLTTTPLPNVIKSHRPELKISV